MLDVGVHTQYERLSESLLNTEGVPCGGTSALACGPLLPHPYFACVPSAMTGRGHFSLPAASS
eukprot:556487-Pelagomonas_calceolata.AAC.1